jgi:ubiquinone/menaquinone biosynthesis C-methylase UbiE
MIMSYYDEHILPYLLNLAMQNRDLASYRRRVVPRARGRVLEVGIGSGLNLPFYGADVAEVIGLDPSPSLLAMAEKQAAAGRIPMKPLPGSAEAIPLDDRSVDSVLVTWSLCSIPDASAALSEMRRVLKPGGDLIFVEHGKAPDRSVSRWQDRLTPLWKKVSGGCHLNRPMDALIEGAGFAIKDLERGYMRGPRPFTYMYEGRARPR